MKWEKSVKNAMNEKKQKTIKLREKPSYLELDKWFARNLKVIS